MRYINVNDDINNQKNKDFLKNKRNFNIIKQYLSLGCSFCEVYNNLRIDNIIISKHDLYILLINNNQLFNMLENNNSKILNNNFIIRNPYIDLYKENTHIYKLIKEQLEHYKLTKEISNKLLININVVNKIIHDNKLLKMQLFNNLRGLSFNARKMSIMEKETYYLLLNENISFDYQHCFKDCVNKSILPFDFYIPNLNTVIELQGEQHYHSTNFFGGKKKFEMRNKNDIIKEKYCYEHHINLLKIHYLANIKEVLIKNKIIKGNKKHYFNNKLDNYLLNRLPNIKAFKIYNQYLNINNYNKHLLKTNNNFNNITNNSKINNVINNMNKRNIRYDKEFKNQLYVFAKENDILSLISKNANRKNIFFIAIAIIIYNDDKLLFKFKEKYKINNFHEKANINISGYKNDINIFNKNLRKLNINWRCIEYSVGRSNKSTFKCIFCGKTIKIWKDNIFKNPFCSCDKSQELKLQREKDIYLSKHKKDILKYANKLNSSFLFIKKRHYKSRYRFYIYLKCLKHNKIYFKEFNQLKKLKQCPICKDYLLSDEYFIKQFNNINKKENYNYQLIKIFTKFKNKYFLVNCPKHGKFEICKTNFLHNSKCPLCAYNFKYTSLLNKLLIDNNIDFINRYCFDDKQISKYIFDFAIIKNNKIECLIEVFHDGISLSKLSQLKQISKDKNIKFIQLNEEQSLNENYLINLINNL